MSPVLVLLLAACGPDLQVEMLVSEVVPTVVTVRWTASEPVAGRIRFGVDGDLDRATPWEAAAVEHETVLLGLGPEQDVRIEVEAEQEGDPWATAEAFARTGSYGADVPRFTITPGSGEAFSGYVAVPSWERPDGSGSRLAAIFDPAGRLVWATPLDEGEIGVRVRPSRDGSGVYYATASLYKDDDWPEAIHHVSWDGDTHVVLDTPGLHHDFVELVDGRLAWLGVEDRDVEGTPVVVDTLEQVARDGTREVAWRAWDHLEALGLSDLDPGEYGEENDVLHMNHLVASERDGTFLLTALRPGLVALVDATSGDPLWVFGGQGSTFSLPSGEPPLGRIHGAAWNGERLSVFQNDRGDARTDCSRVRRYALDERSAEPVSTVALDPCTWVWVFGGVEDRPDGGSLVTWSTAGRIDELDAAENLVYRLEGPVGSGFGYAVVVPSLYPEP
ncbi:MAG: hypothetical protein JXB39_11875 [Deltaproteobacteria bacterium]|nr:hypothetical protein [Deltaproteobacteria bacterium]